MTYKQQKQHSEEVSDECGHVYITVSVVHDLSSQTNHRASDKEVGKPGQCWRRSHVLSLEAAQQRFENTQM